LGEVEILLLLRDRMNAKIHLARPKYSPLTTTVSRTVKNLATLLQTDPIPTDQEEESLL
jgi:hypothetical protein